MSNYPTLKRLIAPYKLNDFFQNYFKKKHLVIKRNNADFYQEILTDKEIDIFLQNSQIPCSHVAMVNKGQTISSEKWGKYSKESGLIADNEKVFDNLNNGSTLVINAANKSISKVSKYTDILKQEFSFDLQSNIY